MKVIELLTKIANGEIKEEIMFQYNNGYEEYANVNTLFDRFTINKENLNTEIEIIEEDKKIDKIKSMNTDCKHKNWEFEELSKEEITLDIQTLKNKINEIIDYLDKGE